MSIQSTGLGDDEAVLAEGRLSEDLLRGIKSIAEFIGETPRKTFYLAERKYIPIGKEGASWIASKKRLREHYQRITGAIA
jgi:hypothetical protein